MADSISRVTDSLEAITLRNQLATHNYANQNEYNQRVLYAIYLSTGARGRYVFDSVQYGAVKEIAHQCFVQGGPSVFTARAMLVWVEEPDLSIYDSCYLRTGDYRKEESSTQSSPNELFVSIAPTVNCNGRQFTFAANKDCQLNVYDAAGRVVGMHNFTKGTSRFQLDAHLPAGYYFCKVMSDKEIRQQKLVLVNCE
jgi:hypothetical protein